MKYVMPKKQTGSRPMNGVNTEKRACNLHGNNKKKKDNIAHYEKTKAQERYFKEKEEAEKERAVEKRLIEKRRARAEAAELDRLHGFTEEIVEERRLQQEADDDASDAALDADADAGADQEVEGGDGQDLSAALDECGDATVFSNMGQDVDSEGKDAAAELELLLSMTAAGDDEEDCDVMARGAMSHALSAAVSDVSASEALPGEPAVAAATQLPEQCVRRAAAALARGVALEPIVFGEELPTAAAAAARVGVEVGAIVNSLVYEIKGAGVKPGMITCTPAELQLISGAEIADLA